MNKMLRYLSDYKRESVLAPLFKMLEATFDLFVPLVMADIVNVGIAAHDFHYILVRCGILLLLAIVGLTCSLTAQYFSAKAAVGYSTGLRHALFEHIQTLSFSEMDTMGTSTLITRMTSDLNDILTALHKPLHPAFCRCSINPASIHTADCYGRRNRGQHCEKRKLFDFNHGAPPTL